MVLQRPGVGVESAVAGKSWTWREDDKPHVVQGTTVRLEVEETELIQSQGVWGLLWTHGLLTGSPGLPSTAHRQEPLLSQPLDLISSSRGSLSEPEAWGQTDLGSKAHSGP